MFSIPGRHSQRRSIHFSLHNSKRDLRTALKLILVQEKLKGAARRKRRLNCTERFPMLKRPHARVALAFCLLVKNRDVAKIVML